MASPNFIPQSFFMFCKGQSPTKLTLPAAFVDRHSINHDRVSLQLKTDPGRTWLVKIRKNDGIYYFVDGWSDFVDDNGVREMIILLFHIVGDSALEVSIYSEDSCLKIPSPPLTVASPVDDDEHGDGGRRWRFIKKLKDYIISDKRMDFPRKVAMGTGLAKKESVELENEEGVRWTVTLTDRNKNMYSFSGGWNDFVVENNLKKDAILLFEYMREDEVVKVVVMDKEKGEKLLSRAMYGGFLPS